MRTQRSHGADERSHGRRSGGSRTEGRRSEGAISTTGTFTAAYPDLFRGGYRVAFRLLGDREEAFDVAQEACARAYVRWDDVELVNPVAWVVRASTNLAIDRWRRLRTAARYATDNPVEIDLRLAERIDLHRALDALPERQREVVLLRYIADLAQEDVAVALGCRVGTVKTHASRGLASLRAALDLRAGT